MSYRFSNMCVLLLAVTGLFCFRNTREQFLKPIASCPSSGNGVVCILRGSEIEPKIAKFIRDYSAEPIFVLKTTGLHDDFPSVRDSFPVLWRKGQIQKSIQAFLARYFAPGNIEIHQIADFVVARSGAQIETSMNFYIASLHLPAVDDLHQIAVSKRGHTITLESANGLFLIFRSALLHLEQMLGSVRASLGSIRAPSQRANLNPVNYRLRESCNRKHKREENQRGIGVVPMADENYKFLAFSEQFSDAGSELSEFDWKWFPLGIGGFVCFLCGIGMYFFSKRRSVTLGIILTVVGWACGQIGFIRCFK
jgi:hypothetical protein